MLLPCSTTWGCHNVQKGAKGECRQFLDVALVGVRELWNSEHRWVVGVMVHSPTTLSCKLGGGMGFHQMGVEKSIVSCLLVVAGVAFKDNAIVAREQ